MRDEQAIQRFLVKSLPITSTINSSGSKLVGHAQAYGYCCDWARNDKSGFTGSYWYYILRGLTDVSSCLVMVTSMIPGLMAVALRTHHVRQY